MSRVSDGHSRTATHGQQNPHDRLAGDQAGGEQRALLLDHARGLRRSAARQSGRQPTASRRRRRSPEPSRTAGTCPRRSAWASARRTGSARCRRPRRSPISPQAIWPPTMPLASCAISPACGAGSARPPMPPVARLASCSTMIGPIRKNESRMHGHNLHHLHLPRRAAEQVAGLEVLNQRSRDAARAADHRRHAQHRRHARRSLHADGQHHQRGDHQRGQREARNAAGSNCPPGPPGSRPRPRAGTRSPS